MRIIIPRAVTVIYLFTCILQALGSKTCNIFPTLLFPIEPILNLWLSYLFLFVIFLQFIYSPPQLWQFLDDDTTVTFADMSSHFAANTIKLAVQIRNWPFRSLQNSLALVLESNTSSDASQCVKKNEDENANLKWFTINVDGVTLYLFFNKTKREGEKQITLIASRYGQFINTTIVDGVLRQVEYKLASDGSVIATLPHFWINAGIDKT